MIKINVISRNKAWFQYIKYPEKYIENRILKINKKYKKFKQKKIYCTLLLSDGSEIKRLNKKFRKKNKSTDVLSFPFYDKKIILKKLVTDKEIYLGDIIINFSKVIFKKKKKSKFLDEFNKLWIHGLAHLFGFDHKNNKDFKVMKQVEKELLSYIN